MVSKSNTLQEVNKVYKIQNPSQYFTDYKEIKEFCNNRKNFLLKLKLPHKIFKDSSLIDFGSGSGQNTILYDSLGSNCTLIEYDKQSCKNSAELFKKFAKNKYKIINEDIFKFNKSKKKYDFVVSNGVAHHTKDPKKNIKICCDALKKGGFFILGIGETHGGFQRQVQRLILYKICKNNDEIIKYSKILFKNHLARSVQFSGRTMEQIIYDTYINPKIETLSAEEVINEFNINNLILYSSSEPIKDLNSFINPHNEQFKLVKNKTKKQNISTNKKILINNLHSFSLTEESNLKINKLSFLYEAISLLTKITNRVNDCSYSKINESGSSNKMLNFLMNDLINFKKKILKIKKIKIINTNYEKIFISEMIDVFKILNSKNKKIQKFNKIKNFLKKSKAIFHGKSGVGMNYFVGFKPE